MDSDALAKATKASLREDVVENLDVSCPARGRARDDRRGKPGDHADALAIEKNVDAGQLTVEQPASTGELRASLDELGLDGGEAQVLGLHATSDSDLIVSDDARFLRTVEGLGFSFTTPASLVALLAYQGTLSREAALEKLDELAPTSARPSTWPPERPS